MTRHISNSSKLDPEDFPHLTDFARGYLHEDVILEYGSAWQAAEAYLRDVDSDERQHITEDAVRFHQQIENWTKAEAVAAFASLGSAWAPASKADLDRVLRILAGG